MWAAMKGWNWKVRQPFNLYRMDPLVRVTVRQRTISNGAQGLSEQEDDPFPSLISEEEEKL